MTGSPTTWAMGWLCVLLLVSAGAAGRSPGQSGAVFNVRDYGGTANDGTDDREAIRAAVQAARAAGGGTVYFPPGIYLTSHTEWKSLARISFRGAGRGRTVIRRSGEHPMTFSFVDCSDLTFRDLALDANGCLNYGGTYFLSCRRVRITDTRYFDSNTAARRQPHTRTDIYACVFGRGETHNEDVVIRRNLIEDLQLEVDYCRRVQITENRVLRPARTAGIGTFSLQWNSVTGEDVCGEDILIADNLICDLSEAYTAIAVHLDPAVHNDQTPLNTIIYRNIRILRNRIIYPAGSGTQAGKAIQVGATDSSQRTRGVIFDRIRIEGNRIYIHPSAGIRPEPGIGAVAIFGNHSREFSGGPDFRFTNVTIQNNSLYHDGKPEAKLVRFYAQGPGYRERNNRILPYAAPPKRPSYSDGMPDNLK
jgi:hypothetical protein